MTATAPTPQDTGTAPAAGADRDTKTARSRRALGMPAFATAALARLQQREGRTTGSVFATRDGGELDAANIRREFRAAIKEAHISGTWSPREFRHTFVSLMSDSGVPVEEIARLAGHTSSRTTEIVYRHPARHGKRRPGPWTSSSDAPPDPFLRNAPLVPMSAYVARSRTAEAAARSRLRFDTPRPRDPR
jgi:hypothetical protein